MTTKRRNLGDLNSDNWDQEDAPEEKGTFHKAPEDEIKNRVIMTARRRIAPTTESKDAPPPGIFSGFGGFSKTTTAPAALSSPFAFLSKTSSTPTVTSTNGPPKVGGEKKTDSGQGEYHKKLVELNNSLLAWVRSKVEKNPLIILSPIFADYEKHLKEIQKLDAPAQSPAMKGFTFGMPSSTSPGESTKKSPTAVGSPPTFGAALTASASTGFSFGASKPFTFGNVAKPPAEEDKEEKGGEENDEESDEPPKVTFTPVVEEDSVFSKRCKVFIKADEGYKERGIGTLYLKSVSDGKKIQLIVRADTSLGNVLVNLLLTKGIPAKILGSNNVMMVCIPSGDFDKPVSMLLKVKTAKEAEELLAAIEKYATD